MKKLVAQLARAAVVGGPLTLSPAHCKALDLLSELHSVEGVA